MTIMIMLLSKYIPNYQLECNFPVGQPSRYLSERNTCFHRALAQLATITAIYRKVFAFILLILSLNIYKLYLIGK